MSKPTLDDCVFNCLKQKDVNGNVHYWTFWDLQSRIKDKVNTFYGEPSISAAIRNLRKDYARARYGLPRHGEIVIKRRRAHGKGYEYKLTADAVQYMSEDKYGIR